MNLKLIEKNQEKAIFSEKGRKKEVISWNKWILFSRVLFAICIF